MSKEITGVDALLGAIHEEPAKPGMRTMVKSEDMYGMGTPNWGPPASLDAQDAGSRLGIDMGEPTVKAAALRHALLYDEQALEKIALGMPQAMSAGKKVWDWGKKFFSPGGRAAAAPKQSIGQRSRGFFQKRRDVAKQTKADARAARQATHEKRTAGMTGMRKRTADLGHSVQEGARKYVPAVGAAGFTGASGHEALQSDAVRRRISGGVSGYAP